MTAAGRRSAGSNFPFRSEKGNLHGILKENPFLEPFIDLPSKENGLDVEGFTASDGKSLFFGHTARAWIATPSSLNPE